MKFEKYQVYFKEYLSAKNFSERTVHSYTHEIQMFISFLDKNYPRISNITQITKDVCFDFVNYLTCYKDKRDKSLSSKTIKVKIVSIKNFFKYLHKNDFILNNPSSLLENPREEKDLPRSVLTEEEVKEILTKIQTNTPIGLRNKAILELFYSSGIRTSELGNLKIQDIDLKEQVATIVRGKGNKTRIVPVGQHACYYIEQYLIKARKFMLKGVYKDEGYLFLTAKGTHFNRETLNKCVVAEIMKNVKIKKHVTCYTFRHCCATHLVKNHVDIRYVGQLLGHESLRTTQKYVHLEISDLKKMHSLYHPRELEKI